MQRTSTLQLRNDIKSVNGFAGCNTFTGSCTVNGNDLSFGPLAATRKACPAGTETETEFFQMLDGTTHFSIHEETLTLLNERKKPVCRLVAVYFD
jgi:heat shock protein HslJ